jgi:N-acetylglucosamine malate deacetylase 1
MNTVSRMLLRRLYRLVFTREAKHSRTLLFLLNSLVSLDDLRPPVESITDFSAQQVVVLAPHMDDEVLGCGGTMRKHILSETHVTVVYMTDGRKGDPDLYHQGLPEAVIVAQEAALVAKRRQEAKRAAEIIGIQEQIFLDNPDGGLEPLPQVTERVRHILAERRPTVIYLPSILDLHRDHWATNRIFAAAIEGLTFSRGWSPVYRGYEVWSPFLVNRLADISEVIAIKEHAIKQFESQIIHTDFVHTSLGLNAHRSLYLSRGCGYAEAFYESTPEQYRLFFQRLSMR